MAIRSNSFYNDPAMAQAAANLADLFAPPSGSDASGYASARQTDMETGQRQALWDYLQRPDYDKALADRESVIAHLYAPTQSYEAVQSTADTQRYGYDTQATTLRANNAADNVRALATNAADNTRALTTNTADNTRALTTNTADNTRAFLQTLYGNLGQGDVRPAVTPEIASLFGLPEMPQQQGAPKPLSLTEVQGGTLADLIMAAKQADPSGAAATELMKQSVLGTDVTPTLGPDGQPTIANRFDAAGQTPVLSETEQKGRIIGGLTPEQQMAAALGTDVVQTIDANGNISYTPRYEAAGKTPVPGQVQGLDTYVRPDKSTFVGYADAMGKIHDQSGALVPDAIKKGVSDSQQNLQGLDSYVRGDGTTFVGFADNTGKIHNQNGQLEPNAIRKGELPASAQGVLGKPTEGQIRTGYAEEMSAEPTKAILKAFDTGALPTMADYALFRGMERLPPESYPLVVKGMTPAGQLFYQNLRSALPMQALVKSGIAVNETERLQLLLELVPIPGEDPGATLAKRRQFETFSRAAARAAGSAATPLEATPPESSPQATATSETPPAAASTPAAAAATVSPEDRAASIANAKAAIASGDYTKPEAIDLLKQNGIEVKPGELD